MPSKWKFFFALNLIVGLPAFILLILSIITFFQNKSDDGDYYLIWVIAISALLVVTINSFMNIFLLQRYYPDKLIPDHFKQLEVVSLSLTIITSIGMLLVCIFAAADEFSGQYRSSNNTGKIVLLIFFLGLIIQIVVLVMQGQLPRIIMRNHREKMRSMIDSIGQ